MQLWRRLLQETLDNHWTMDCVPGYCKRLWVIMELWTMGHDEPNFYKKFRNPESGYERTMDQGASYCQRLGVNSAEL